MKLKKIFKLFLSLLVFAIILVFPKSHANAATDSIDDITITVEVNDNSIATITEVWNVNMYSGTELYKSYTNLETSEISNLSVTDETGTKYTFLSNWNISASQSEKTNKCGIYTSENSTDICWGIGEYGNHIYTIKYNISNFVQQYDNYQSIYFTLLPSSVEPSPSNVTITLSTNFNIDANTTSIEGTGFTGTSTIENGKAVFKSTSAFSSSNYMTIYLKFSNNPFSNAEIISSNNLVNNPAKMKSWKSYIPYILVILIVILVVRFIINRRNNNTTTHY